MTPEEAQAVLLVWEAQGKKGTPIPEDEARSILVVVRERAARIEARVLKMGRSRWSESRRFPRRHYATAFFILILLDIAIYVWISATR